MQFPMDKKSQIDKLMGQCDLFSGLESTPIISIFIALFWCYICFGVGAEMMLNAS